MNQGDALKKILKERGLTQQDVADNMGVNRTYLTNQFKAAELPRKLIKQISDVLNIPFDELISKITIDPEMAEKSKALEEKVKDQAKIISLLEEQLELYKAKFRDILG